MKLIDFLKDQLLDVIEFEDKTGKLIVTKFIRKQGDNELKQGSKIIVREGQNAVFIKGGQLADVLAPGTYSLITDHFPILTKMMAFPYLFISPVISDVYFVSTKQFIDNKWATKNPILKRDKDLNMVRIRAYGKFSFQITNVATFMREVFGTKGVILSYELIEYFSAMVTEAFSTAVGESKLPVLDLASQYRNFSGNIQIWLNAKSASIGVRFSDILIENLSLPDEVERIIDAQSEIQIAKQDISSYVQYQTALAMRDASKQDGGLAGLGAGLTFGQVMAQNIQSSTAESPEKKSKTDQLRELKALLDDGILTREEFEAEKKLILGK